MLGTAFVIGNVIGWSRPVEPVEHRFRIEQVNVTRPAMHIELNHRFGSRLEVRRGGRMWTGGV